MSPCPIKSGINNNYHTRVNLVDVYDFFESGVSNVLLLSHIIISISETLSAYIAHEERRYSRFARNRLYRDSDYIR
jgi:hypothetical protein